MTEQLHLFLEPNGNGHRRMTREEAGLRREMPPGSERLLAAMVKRGLPAGDLRVAAALCIALDTSDEEGAAG